MNWCQFFLNEFIKEKIEAIAKMTPFNYGFLLLAFDMFNWDPSQEFQLISMKKWLVLISLAPLRP
jgi:hypothetical protein